MVSIPLPIRLNRLRLTAEHAEKLTTWPENDKLPQQQTQRGPHTQTKDHVFSKMALSHGGNRTKLFSPGNQQANSVTNYRPVSDEKKNTHNREQSTHSALSFDQPAATCVPRGCGSKTLNFCSIATTQCGSNNAKEIML